MHLILYSKPDCHLCEGLQEKLEAIAQSAPDLALTLEVRDITTRDDWFAAYQYEIPVLCDSATGQVIPRPSPRATVVHLEQILRRTLGSNG
jgi:hypothetical protein